MSLTIQEILDVSRTRMRRWHGETDWNALEWAGAMAGEAGEAANYAKKLRRIEQGMNSIKAGKLLNDAEDIKRHVAKEVADTILYAVLLVDCVGQDLEATIVEVFNAKSEEYGFPERL